MTKEQKYLKGWAGLSEYLGGVPRSTLVLWEKEGRIKKYSLGGRNVFFDPKEIDEAMKDISNE